MCFPAFTKICCRCGTEYKININGNCVRKEECVFHWGRLRRQKGKFVFIKCPSLTIINLFLNFHLCVSSSVSRRRLGDHLQLLLRGGRRSRLSECQGTIHLKATAIRFSSFKRVIRLDSHDESDECEPSIRHFKIKVLHFSHTRSNMSRTGVKSH